MAIQIKLALARDHVDDPELASELDEIGADASLAVDDLRGLAHGIYPTVLRERGLGDGLRSLARNAPLHIDVVDAGIGRSDPAVEAAVYFCVLEAIQNAMKHAGAGARVEITLDRLARDIRFGVADDGVGFDLAERSDGIGLQSMRDRIDALGGELVFDSAPGAGTRIRGTVPA
jgi:signal transduction histidine kinase